MLAHAAAGDAMLRRLEARTANWRQRSPMQTLRTGSVLVDQLDKTEPSEVYVLVREEGVSAVSIWV